ncbi:LAFE_0C04236g1_1 [Lachancea fermentati]|uniref:U2 small nuclear ribonucleoprotein A' n=1 Tax=Lachancea fermentati TaxID=4955 RepID=A0A1G4M9D6_LACFM|nr:LAFE_0C04236g1_1 [Lachancea fermentati]
MKITPSTVIDAPTYYASYFNGRLDTDKVLILRDLNLESDGDSMPTVLSQIPIPTNVVDMTNNDLTQLPPLQKRADIHTLLLSRNRIVSIDGRLLPTNILNLSLANNGIDRLEQLNGLRNSPQSLENLNLRGNAICYFEDYRSHVLSLLPQLKVLDFQKVKGEELEHITSRKFDSNAASTGSSKGSSRDKDAEVMSNVVSKMDEKAKQNLRDQLAKATTLAEIERLEKVLAGEV